MSIKWRPLSSLCFGDNIDLMADSTVSSRPSKTRLDKSKVMVNTIGQEKAEIHLNSTQLKRVSFKYLKSMRSKDGSSAADIQYWILAATAAQVRLNKIWDSRSISFITKFNLQKSLVVSIMLYGSQMWTLLRWTAGSRHLKLNVSGDCYKPLTRNKFICNQLTSTPLSRSKKLTWIAGHNTLPQTVPVGKDITVVSKRKTRW